jgi:hypothetical protein
MRRERTTISIGPCMPNTGCFVHRRQVLFLTLTSDILLCSAQYSANLEPVPSYAVDAARQSNWTKTCGSIIKSVNMIEGDWHHIYDTQGRTRVQIMTKTVSSMCYC